MTIATITPVEVLDFPVCSPADVDFSLDSSDDAVPVDEDKDEVKEDVESGRDSVMYTVCLPDTVTTTKRGLDVEDDVFDEDDSVLEVVEEDSLEDSVLLLLSLVLVVSSLELELDADDDVDDDVIVDEDVEVDVDEVLVDSSEDSEVVVASASLVT